MSENKTKSENSAQGGVSSKLADAFEFNLMIFASDFLRYIKRLWAFVIAVAIVFAAGEYVIAKKRFVPVYRSSVSFSISTLNTGSTSVAGACEYSNRYSGTTLSTQLGNTFSYIISSSLMNDVLKSDLGVSYINGQITTKVIESTNIFKITVTIPSAPDAYDIVNSIVDNYPRVADYVIGDTDMEIYVKPKLAENPINAMAWKKKVLFAAGCGGLLVILFAAVLALMRRTE